MADNTKYEIEIYHVGGVHFRARIRGKQRYLKEKAFLAELTGQVVAAAALVPDPTGDFYALNDEQLDAYSAFRKQLKKLEGAA